jgi:phosphoheptose isomerase
MSSRADGADPAGRLEAHGIPLDDFGAACGVLESALRRGGKVLVFGNGGSAADAQHFAAELLGRFAIDRPGLPAVALTTDSSTLTAIANDFGFDQVFARQVSALGAPGDVALAITTSGGSENVLAALDAARALGMRTICLTGAKGAALASRADVVLVAPHDDTARVQEAHLAIEHALCAVVEHALFASDDPLRGRPRRGRGEVVSRDELLERRERWREGGRTVVFTNGVFDLLHVGHVRGLDRAATLGDVLVVAVNDDDSVRRLKGESRPLVPAEERAELLAALAPVDYVVVFDELEPSDLLRELRPDVVCKGADYAPPHGKPMPERVVVEEYGGRIEFLPLVEGRSTTDLAGRLGG